MLDQCGEVLGSAVLSFRDMADTRKAGVARRINAILITVLRRNDTVGRHQDRAVKGFKFAILLPPGIAVIAYEMLIFLKCRIIVGRQHFAVRIHVYAGSFRLLEQLFHILQVVAADKNARPVSNPDIYLRNFRISVSRGVRIVKHRHGVYAVLASLHRQSDQILHFKTVVKRSRKRTAHEPVQLAIVLLQVQRMVRISSHPLQAVSDQFAERANIFVTGGEDANCTCFYIKIGFFIRFPDGSIREIGRSFGILFIIMSAHLAAERNGFPDFPHKNIAVKVGIRNGCEQGVHGKQRYALFKHFGQPDIQTEKSDTFQQVNEQIL
ncbi:hypothetical protein D3C72_909660 [compost metagenome]